MLDPEYLFYLTDGAEEISNRMEIEIIKAIIERILARQRRGDDYILTATDKWAIETLEEQGVLLTTIAKIIAKYTGIQQAEIINAMIDAEVEALAYDESIYANAGLTPYKKSDIPEMVQKQTQSLGISQEEAKRRARKLIKQSPYVRRVNERIFKATMGTWHNMTGTVAFQSARKYVEIVDKAYTDTMMGAKSYTAAVKEAIDEMAQNGVTIQNAAGRSESIESATLRNVRTGVSQSTAEITLERMKEMDVDHVMVSSHLGARYGDGGENPGNHGWWQGKIYQYVGLIPGEPRSEYPDFIKSTGYGTGEGLCGWNCRHSFGPYIEGMHNPYTQYDEKANKERYDLEQKARAKERAIRKKKKEVAAYEAAVENMPDSPERDELMIKLQSAKQKLANMNKDYIDFCNEHNLRPLTERLEIAKTERSKNYANTYENLKNYNDKIKSIEVKHEKSDNVTKALEVDDFEMMADANGVQKEVIDIITKTIKEYEKNGKMYFSDFNFSVENPNAILETTKNAYGQTILNVNLEIIANHSLATIDKTLKDTQVNYPINLREAVIHEIGHAKAYYGKTKAQVEKMNKELKKEHNRVEEMSFICLEDGAEVIAETEVLLSRGEKIPKKAKELYRKYTGGKI